MADTQRFIARLAAASAVHPEERRLAGRIGGALYCLCGLTGFAFSFMPGVTHAHRGVLLAMAAVGLIWGLCSIFVLDWERLPTGTGMAATAVGLVLTGIAIASSGGAQSPAWI